MRLQSRILGTARTRLPDPDEEFNYDVDLPWSPLRSYEPPPRIVRLETSRHVACPTSVIGRWVGAVLHDVYKIFWRRHINAMCKCIALKDARILEVSRRCEFEASSFCVVANNTV